VLKKFLTLPRRNKALDPLDNCRAYVGTTTGRRVSGSKAQTGWLLPMDCVVTFPTVKNIFDMPDQQLVTAYVCAIDSDGWENFG
jgi:hypothetical protein